MQEIGFATTQDLAVYAQVMLNQTINNDGAYSFFGVEFSEDAKNYTLRALSGPYHRGPLVDPKVADSDGPSDCRPEWQRYRLGVDGKGTWNGRYTDSDPSKQQQLDDQLPSQCNSNKYLTSGFLSIQLALDAAMFSIQHPEGKFQVNLRPLPRPAFSENFASQTFWMRCGAPSHE